MEEEEKTNSIKYLAIGAKSFAECIINGVPGETAAGEYVSRGTENLNVGACGADEFKTLKKNSPDVKLCRHFDLERRDVFVNIEYGGKLETGSGRRGWAH